MKVILQRSRQASVTVNNEIVGQIDKGFVLLVGIGPEDTDKELQWMADKITGLRIFEETEGKMDLDITQVGGAILSVSQFTLFADCRKGRRPNFMGAAKPDMANQLYDKFNALLREKGLQVETGMFGEMMDVALINDGPVTIILDTDDLKKKFVI